MGTAIGDRARTVGHEPVGGKAAPLLAAGGLLGALLASSCCLLPVTLVALGLGGAWLGLLAPLAPFQPLFVALAATSLGVGFWLAYWPAATCAADGGCAVPTGRRTARAVLWLGASLLVAAIAFEPLILPRLFG